MIFENLLFLLAHSIDSGITKKDHPASKTLRVINSLLIYYYDKDLERIKFTDKINFSSYIEMVYSYETAVKLPLFYSKQRHSSSIF